jgi:tetratricopeptide (TPR) repeat protein/tRNA A-37 threonylcarbamoyl transferase component Bud32
VNEGPEPTADQTGTEATLDALEGTALDDDAPVEGWGDEPALPHRIGRFLVLKELGSGAMGVVFAAYDEDLDRKVAVKLLRLGTQDRAERRARLVREAQALAKLSHPNVVQVYEVGTHQDQVFVAMEFLTGQTLGQWMRAGPHSVEEIVEVFAQAGRGLAAAHRAGLAHRDFKPENAFVDVEGRVRVLDFGLARATDRTEDRTLDTEPDLTEQLERLGASASGSRPGALRSPDDLTMTGALMGTPAYMSPEQFTGAAAGPASDQFSYCVALWEAVYGVRPFRGNDALTLAFNVKQGKIRETPKDAKVPAWLDRVIVRGLATDPESRWPSMSALVEELTRTRGSKSRTWMAASAVVVLTVGLIGVGMRGEDPATSVCASVDDALAGTWDDAAASGIDRAFRATGLGYADEAAARVRAGLDAYASAWLTARRDACEATHVRKEQSQHLLDLRVACLDSRRAGLEALVETLQDAEADAEIVERSASAVAGLPAVGPCNDRDRLLARVPPPEDAETAEAVQSLRERLARATATGDAGRLKPALTELEALAEEARALDYPPVHAEVLFALGDTRIEVGEMSAAEGDLAQAFSIALTAGDDETATAAASKACNLVGYLQQRYGEGLQWGKTGLALAQRSGAHTLPYARVMGSIGSIYFRQGEYEKAAAQYERVLEIERDLVPDDADALSATINNLSAVHYYMGQREQATRELRESIELAEGHYGPTHPEVGVLYQNLAAHATYRDDWEAARTNYQKAYDIALASRGEMHPSVAAPLAALGKLDLDAGEVDRARERLERALAIFTKVHGEWNVDRATPLTHLGTLEARHGDPDRAVELYEQAIEVVRKTVGSEHPRITGPLEMLARVEIDRHPARAVELVEESIAVWEQRQAGTAQHARALWLHARALSAAGKRDRALERADEAEALLREHGLEKELAELTAWRESGGRSR